MSRTVQIPSDARGHVVVLALDVPDRDRAAFLDMPKSGPDRHWPLRAAVGADFLTDEGIEAFPASDLTGLGLPDYLVQGLGIEPADLERDRAALLDAEFVVLLNGSAFGNVAQTLTIKPPLRLIGHYAEPRPAFAPDPLPHASAEGSMASPMRHAETPPRGPVLTIVLASLAVILIAAISWIIWGRA